MAEAENMQMSPMLAMAPQQPQAQPRNNYQLNTPLVQIVDYLLTTPSVPEELRREFFVFWEMTVLGNFDQHDIDSLYLKFRGWCNHLLMTTPDCEWSNRLVFKDRSGSAAVLQELPDGSVIEVASSGNEICMDLSMLIDQLDIAFSVQLTRGKDGFTTKELTTVRNRSIISEESGKIDKKGWRLF